MLLKYLKNEEGFWSALAMLLLVTLALMGLGGYALMRSEGVNVANQISAIQADYAANAAAYYGIQRLTIGVIDETAPLTIGNCTVALDTSLFSGTSDIILDVMASNATVNRGIRIRISTGGVMADKAIYTTGHVFNVTAKDSTGTADPTKLVHQASSIPTIDEASLAAMSTAQGHDQWGTPFTPLTGYPNGSFYQPDGVTPNVTHVMNDMVVGGGVEIHGIFVVEGHVTLHGSSRVDGVIYLPNPTSTIITGGGIPTESSITGGIVSHGDISGFGNHISVTHWPEYMAIFCVFQTGADIMSAIVNWQYI